jgi:hypothetical protein
MYTRPLLKNQNAYQFIRFRWFTKLVIANFSLRTIPLRVKTKFKCLTNSTKLYIDLNLTKGIIMMKNVVVILLLYSLVSCIIYRGENRQAQNSTIALSPNERCAIIGVVKKDNSIVEFNNRKPGLIRDSVIVGEALSAQGDVSEVAIPIKDVTEVRIKKIDGFKTTLATAGLIAGGTVLTVGVVVAIIIATKESCPFIYSYDGSEYHFDAEPYGGAICEALCRTEWCTLEHMKAVNGVYRMKLTNEVDETQFTDELKLVVVDHPCEYTIAPDISGNMHTFKNPCAPTRAFNGAGRDLMPYVSKNDWVYWNTMEDSTPQLYARALRSEITLVFPKPDTAKKVKLLANASTTLWGSQMLKRYLSLGGNRIHSWYKKVNRIAASGKKPVLWTDKAQLYEMKVFALTRSGWKEKTVIQGGGPFISEDKCYMFDVSDIPGDSLKIKFSAAVNFWQFNYFAVDYSEDIPLHVSEIGALKAVDSHGKDVRELLAAKDKKYQIMPKTGDHVEIEFSAPAEQPGNVRTILAKTTGYYDIHLSRKGMPDLAKLHKLENDPDYAIEFASQEYHIWAKNPGVLALR